MCDSFAIATSLLLLPHFCFLFLLSRPLFVSACPPEAPQIRNLLALPVLLIPDSSSPSPYCCFGVPFRVFWGFLDVFCFRKFVKMSLRPNARVEVRKKGYKLAVDADEARRKREDNMVEIRKSKREESLLKKRRDGMPQLQQSFTPAAQSAAAEKKVCLGIS